MMGGDVFDEDEASFDALNRLMPILANLTNRNDIQVKGVYLGRQESPAAKWIGYPTFLVNKESFIGVYSVILRSE